MAAYKFKMQKLLDLRERVEEERKNELGLAHKRLEKEKNRMAELKALFHEAKGDFEKRASEGMRVDELKLAASYMDYYKKSIRDQATRIKMAEDYVEACRVELIKATQEKKMLEKLKEMDYNKYLYDEQKKEDRLVDDLVSFKESNKA